jgi:hypothetical protein
MDTFDASTLAMPVYLSREPSCYPLSFVVDTMIYGNTVADSCESITRSAEFILSYHSSNTPLSRSSFVSPQNVTELFANYAPDPDNPLQGDLSGLLDISFPLPSIRSLVYEKLNQLTCNGQTILVGHYAPLHAANLEMLCR